jgi:hypothetical protein
MNRSRHPLPGPGPDRLQRRGDRARSEAAGPAPEAAPCSQRQRSLLKMLRQLIVPALAALLAASSARADDRSASSIAEFVESKDRWDRLVGRPMRLEGRYTIFSAGEVKFVGCDLNFVLTRSFRRPPTTTRNIEVAGQLVRSNGGLEFRVTELQPRESDAEQLKLRRALINSSNVQEVYDLAAWARQRGEFYEDKELSGEADRLYREGLEIAHGHLEPGDVEGLRKLAARARQVGVDEGIAHRLLHQADRLEWEAERKGRDTDYRRILGLIRNDLPGAATPLPPERISIRDDYQTAPEAVFRVADERVRRLLARAFYIEVALAEILASADTSGRNGYQIAERIERALPELSTLADEYRRQELTWLTRRVGSLTRTQMVELADRYQQRGNQEQGRQVTREWLEAQEPRAAQAGPTDLMELGDEYINLLRDERAAGRMYKQAYQQNSQLTTARDWLSRHGYELQGNRWTKPGEDDRDTPDAAVDSAIAEGRVQVGMTGSQVLKALGTKPSSSVRMAFSGAVAELWVFGDSGITVRLQRRSSASEAKVVAIGTIE